MRARASSSPWKHDRESRIGRINLKDIPRLRRIFQVSWRSTSLFSSRPLLTVSSFFLSLSCFLSLHLVVFFSPSFLMLRQTLS